jgi:hypothetical protein
MSRSTKNDINKTYLSNTILSIESHNRREEEADCWRQLKMVRKNVQDETASSSIDCRKSTVDADMEERAIWAAKKTRQMPCLATIQVDHDTLGINTNGKRLNDAHDEDAADAKRTKSEKSKKMKKDKKEVKKSKKNKKRKDK